ncbi:MAG: type II secretion system F family protein [Candidatus Levyibacteriota bacterium]|nr:MAG: type II secretion system F family protein [Candidatus Levybacteria bacterium]
MKKLENTTLSANEKIGLIANLATMLAAGIPILEVVDSLLDGAKNSHRLVLQVLRDDISQGQHLYTTFSKFPKVFDKVTVQIVRASEEAGTLEATLRDLQQDIKRQTEFTDKVHSAMVYPLFVSAVFLGVMLLMLTFVIPRISAVFLKLNVVLPLPTKILILLSQTILQYKVASIIGIILFTFSLFYSYKKKRDFFIRILSSFPIINELVKQIDLTKFSRSLYLLLNAGIPITSALELTEDIVTRKDLKKIIIHCKEIVIGGKRLSEGFSDAKHVLPSIMIKITEAGERSGSLEKSMQDISEYLDYQVSTRLKTVTALIEPIMLVLVGLLIGGMMLAIIAPIYNLISQISAR